MDSNKELAVDVAKMSLLTLLTRVQIGQLLSSIVALVGFGFAAGNIQATYTAAKEWDVLQSQLRAAEAKDRTGPFGVMPSNSCDILTRGNDLYKQAELTKALMVYRTVEYVDRLGKQLCTDSVYATIATVNSMLAARLPPSDSSGLALHLTEEAFYLAASGAATKCQKGDCADSLALWKR